MAQFDHVLAHGGVFHLWGHSWVVDTARQWDKLSRVLDYVHGHEGVRYISNIELVETKS